MLERSSWPTWLKNLLPNFLETVNYPRSGIGDLQDLAFQPVISNTGKWTGYINTGWYYHENLEQYNYSVKATKLVAAVSGSVGIASGGYTTTSSVSGILAESISFRPSWGPVLVYSSSTKEPYTIHHNCFYPAVSLTWALSGTCYVATLPSSSLLLNIRDLTNLYFGAVASTGDLLSNKLYWYDQTNNQVWIKSTTSPQAWADVLYTVPKLRVRELSFQESGGVRASYRNIEDVKVYRGDQVYTVTGTVTGSNYISHTLTGCALGDWVVLEYYVTKSYVLTDHDQLQYFIGLNAYDNFIVDYESSVPDIIQSATIQNSAALNYNPIFSDSVRAGYLFHSNPASSISSYWKPSFLRLQADKSVLCGTYNEPVFISAALYDENQLPIPYFPISYSYTSGVSALSTSPTGSVTDGRGEFHILLSPASSMTSIVFSLSASSLTSSVSGSLNITVDTFGNMVTMAKWTSGWLNVIQTNQTNGDGYIRCFSNAISLDGIPRSYIYTLYSDKSTIFIGQDKVPKVGSIRLVQDAYAPNFTSILEFNMLPQGGEVLYAEDGDAQSEKITL